jgi:hypothetical protein
MPTVHRIGPCVIKIFTNDHEPPHFHVEAADFVVKVVIGSWEVVPVAGRARRLAAVLAWARANEELLRRRWQETRSRG